MMRLAYFGPEQDPVHAAATGLATELAAELAQEESTAAVVRAVEDGAADRGLVPLEDGRLGSDRETVDALVFGSAEVRVVAVRAVDQGSGAVDQGSGAVGQGSGAVGQGSGWELQLAVLAAADPPRRRAGRSLLFCVPRRNRPGTLTALLAPFGTRGVNLTKLESRPLGGRMGEYGFLMEVDAGLAEPALHDCLDELVAEHIAVKVLGAYEPPLSRLGLVDDRPLPGEILEVAEDVARLRGRS